MRLTGLTELPYIYCHDFCNTAVFIGSVNSQHTTQLKSFVKKMFDNFIWGFLLQYWAFLSGEKLYEIQNLQLRRLEMVLK